MFDLGKLENYRKIKYVKKCLRMQLCVHICLRTLSKDTGDEDPTQGGDIDKVSVAPCGGVEMSFQRLGVNRATIVRHVDGSNSCV